MSENIENQPKPDNYSKPKNEQEKPKLSYAQFLISLALFICVVGIGLYWVSFCSGWIVKTDSPTPIQFFIVNLFSLFVLGVVAFQAFVYWKQWKAMQENLAQTRELFNLTERPILIIEKVEALLEPNKPVLPTVTIVNKGRSPAQKLEFFFQVSHPGYTHFLFEGKRLKLGFLASQDTHIVHDKRTDRPALGEFDPKILGKETSAFIYVYGEGKYEDLTGKSYPLDRWAFRWTKDYGWIPDWTIIERAPELWESEKVELREWLGLDNDQSSKENKD